MSKKILIVGATGAVGRALVREVVHRHDLVQVGNSRGEYQVDITNSASIKVLFERVGRVDAIVSVAGKLHFGPLTEMTAEQFRVGLSNKLLGQVDLATCGSY